MLVIPDSALLLFSGKARGYAPARRVSTGAARAGKRWAGPVDFDPPSACIGFSVRAIVWAYFTSTWETWTWQCGPIIILIDGVASPVSSCLSALLIFCFRLGVPIGARFLM